MKKSSVKRKILFVCTGNIFRSMSAKYCLQDYLKKKGIRDVLVDSAGTIANKQAMDVVVYETLKELGIDTRSHQQKRITKKDLAYYDLVVVMAKNHAEFIKRKFNFEEVVLFNEVLTNEKTSVDDVNEAIKDNKKHPKERTAYLQKTIRYIHKNTPLFYKNLDNYFLFLDLIRGRRNHSNHMPFIPLHTTPHTTAFMSIAIPQKEDGHVLVVPNKRYMNLDTIPRNIREELLSSVSLIGKALRRTHGGYNVLLNNGRSAGQYILHTHFHIIPRNNNDDINIEVFKRKIVERKEFMRLNENVKREIRIIYNKD